MDIGEGKEGKDEPYIIYIVLLNVWYNTCDNPRYVTFSFLREQLFDVAVGIFVTDTAFVRFPFGCTTRDRIKIY